MPSGKKQNVCLLLACMLAVSALAAGAPRIRPPIARGMLYPADPAELLKETRRLFAEAEDDVPAQDARLRACIAPWGRWQDCGDIAARAFVHLRPGQYDRVLFFAPAMRMSFEGCSIASVKAWLTPLGVVPSDTAAMDKLSRSNLIDLRPLDFKSPGVHEREAGIEMLLPFLQERLLEFRIIPVLTGRLQDSQGRFNLNMISMLADRFRRVIDERTLIVVSSNITHYGNDFSYRPFRENIIPNIQHLDRGAFDSIFSLKNRVFQDYLEKTGNPVPGRLPIHLLMQMIPDHCRGTLAGYRISAAESGDTRRSISYGAICFYDPQNAPFPGRSPVNPPFPEPGREDEAPPGRKEPPTDEE
jgi:MEMO1 family protein